MFTRNKGALFIFIGYFLPVINLITSLNMPTLTGGYNEVTKDGLSFFSYPLFRFEFIIVFIIIIYSLIKNNRLIGGIAVTILIVHFFSFHNLVLVFFNESGEIKPGLSSIVWVFGSLAFLFGKD